MVVSYVDPTAPAVEHCEAMAAEFPDLADRYRAIASACQLKLWHPLTLRALEFCQDPNCARVSGSTGIHTYLGLYDKVLLAFESKLDALSLAVIAARVAGALASGGTGPAEDSTAARAVLENLLAKCDKGTPPHVYLQSKHGLLVLSLQQQPGAGGGGPPLSPDELVGLRGQIKANSALLEASSSLPASSAASIDHVVHAAHYEMCLAFYKLVGPPESFFSSALLFLQYQPVPSSAALAPASSAGGPASSSFWQELGIDLCLSALTGDGVYRNLGHAADLASGLVPESHPGRWLVAVLRAVSAGQVAEFDALAAAHAADVAAQPALSARWDAVREKLRLMALVHLVFDKSASDRVVQFDEIASRLQVAEEQVEWVVMRACSAGILRGSIDEVDRQVQVDWVLPRVLAPDQMRSLASRYGAWAEQVRSVNAYVREQHAAV
jgi:26S proteasome regulatory subunit N9